MPMKHVLEQRGETPVHVLRCSYLRHDEE